MTRNNRLVALLVVSFALCACIKKDPAPVGEPQAEPNPIARDVAAGAEKVKEAQSADLAAIVAPAPAKPEGAAQAPDLTPEMRKAMLSPKP